MEKRTQWFIFKSFTCHKGWKVNSLWGYNLKNLRINLKNKENWAKLSKNTVKFIPCVREYWGLAALQRAVSQELRVTARQSGQHHHQQATVPWHPSEAEGQVWLTVLWSPDKPLVTRQVKLGSRVRKARLGSTRYKAGHTNTMSALACAQAVDS